VEAVAFSPDGQRIAAAQQDYSIHIFDAELAGEMAPSISVPKFPEAVTFVGSAGSHVAVRGRGGFPFLWDPANGVLRELARDALGIATPDAGSRRMAWCTRGGDVVVYDVDRGEVERTIPNFPFREGAGVDSLGLRLVATDLTGSLRALELDTGTILPFRGFAPGPWQVCSMASGGERLVTDSNSNLALEWRPDAARGDRIISAHCGDAWGSVFAPGGDVLLTFGGRDLTLKVWDLENGGLARACVPRAGQPGAQDVSPDGRLVLTLSWGESVCVWDRDSGAVRWRTPFVAKEESNSCGLFDATGEGVLLVQTTGRLEHWQIGASTPDRTGATTFPGVGGRAYDRATDRLALVNEFGAVALFEGTDLALLWKRDPVRNGEARASSAAFAPGGRELAVVTGLRLAILDTKSGAVVRSAQIGSKAYNTTNAEVSGLAYHPDGSRIAVATRASILKLYDARDLEPVATLHGDGGWFEGAWFSPDGRYLAATTAMGNLFLWDAGGAARADVPEPMGALSARRGRELYRAALALVPDIEAAIAALRAGPALSAGDREAALRAAYTELSSPACQVRRAIAVWIADDPDPEIRLRAEYVAFGLARELPGDVESQLALGLSLLRRKSPTEAITALERARRVDPGHASAAWTCASAALAIALVRAERIDEAGAALADARAGPALPVEWWPMLDEAQRALDAGR
jgi:WD40 repeat protein